MMTLVVLGRTTTQYAWSRSSDGELRIEPSARSVGVEKRTSALVVMGDKCRGKSLAAKAILID